MFLPVWSSELQVEIPSWFPWGKDYQPVSVNRFHDSTLRSIAESCFDLESEFYFVASPSLGCVGNLSRDRFFMNSSDSSLNLGFLMLFAFSEKMEKAVILAVASSKSRLNLLMGVTYCSLYRGGIFEGDLKVIAVAADDPFYDCSEFIKELDDVLGNIKKILRAPALSYYAEKFGYDRFIIELENENPYDLLTTQILSEIEDKGAQEIVGGYPKIDFPAFFGISITPVEK